MSVRDRNAMVGRLKDELLAALSIVAEARESLTREIEDHKQRWSKLGVDDKMLKRLTTLTTAFGNLTDSKIRLDKAELALEEDLSPEEEHEVVLNYCSAMTPGEFRGFVAEVKRRTGRSHEAL